MGAERPGEAEGSPALAVGFEGDRAAPAFDRFLDDRQPHPAPLDLVAGPERLEQAEHAVLVLGPDPRPVVGDRELGPVPVGPGRDRDPAVGPVVVLDRVPDEIPDDELERAVALLSADVAEANRRLEGAERGPERTRAFASLFTAGRRRARSRTRSSRQV